MKAASLRLDYWLSADFLGFHRWRNASCAKKCKRRLPANLLDFLVSTCLVRHIQLAFSRWVDFAKKHKKASRALF
jgi:hypothetical protein